MEFGDILSYYKNLTYDNDYDNLTGSDTNLSCLMYGKGRYFDYSWYSSLVLTVCTIGVMGNIVNLVVLTRHNMLHHMDRLERSGTYGLIALAASDMCFCLAQLPEGIYSSDYMWYSMSERHVLYIKLYCEAIKETFMMLSAWVIVIISINRLIVVVYPLRARVLLTGAKTILGIILVAITSFLLTLPAFLYFSVIECQVTRSVKGVELVKALGGGQMWTLMLDYRMKIWPVFATFLPFLIMTLCNVWLIVTLKKATSRRRDQFHIVSRRRSIESSNRITITLLAVVVMFSILVLPIEILLYRDIYTFHHWGHFLDKLFKILKAVNFASNFILYVMVNVKFRIILKSLLPCGQAPTPGNMITRMSEVTVSRNSPNRQRARGQQLSQRSSPNTTRSSPHLTHGTPRTEMTFV